MKKERKYLACWDDGHDCGEFEFYSCHRANSKENIKDAVKVYRMRYSKYHDIKITSVYLVKD